MTRNTNDIFPPTGFQNMERFTSLPHDERDYMMFCLEFCNAVLRENSNHLEALALAAGYYTELGFFADGLKVDKMLAALKPKNPTVLYNLACSYSLNSLLDEAITTLREAVARGYDDSAHIISDRDLTAARQDPRFQSVIDALDSKANEVK